MKKEKQICRKCGHCCVLFPTVCLTPKEVLGKKYKIRKKPLDDDVILQRKRVYIKELKQIRTVCVYFDEKTMKCSIYKDRPKMCREMWCNGDGFKKQWEKLKNH